MAGGGVYEEWRARLPGAMLWTRTDTTGEPGRVLPDGCMDLLWWDGELVIAGPDTRAHRPGGRVGSWCAGLRFAPGLGPRALGVPAHELRDQRVPLGAVWRESAVRELASRAAESCEPWRVLEAAGARGLRGGAREFARVRAPALPPAPAAGELAALLGRGLRVGAVASAVGLSERQLHRRCLDSFGYGPKTLARVLRLRTALGLVADGRPLVTVASRAGYADQAHLTREFRALTGAAPTELRAPPDPPRPCRSRRP